jgi:hypothetical protein
MLVKKDKYSQTCLRKWFQRLNLWTWLVVLATGNLLHAATFVVPPGGDDRRAIENKGQKN